MGTYGSLGVGVGGGRRRWGGAWFALVLTFRKEGRDVGVKEEGKATANGVEEGFVGSGRGEDEAVKDKRGAPSAGLAPVQKPSNRGLSEEKLVYLPPKGFFNRSCRFFDLKKKLWGVPVEAKILSPRADAIKVVLHVSFYKKKF